MSITVRTLMAQPSMGLTLLTTGAVDDQPLTWVHVSELVDPTPFLSGGELLLTTGLTQPVGEDSAAWNRYVVRLAGAGVVGLGFGTGLSHQQVPQSLIAAANRTGVALIEVPRRTPFIAISRAVSQAIAAEEYAEITRTFDAQMALTRGALSQSGTDVVVRLLAGQVGGWVLLVDPAGAPISAHPSAARRRASALDEDLTRLRRHRGPVSASFSQGSDTIDLQPIGTGARRVAYLAVGRAAPASRSQRHLINAAVLLLTMRLQRPTDAPPLEATLRSALLRLLLGGEIDLARQLARQAELPLPSEPVRVLVGHEPSGERPSDLEGGWWAMLDTTSVVLAPEPATDLAHRLAASSDRRIGMSAKTGYGDLPAAVRQATRAAGSTAGSTAGVVAYEDLGSMGVLGLLDPEQARGFAETVLAPLSHHDQQRHSSLIESLRVWLAHHGQWDPAASTLGVHRHTLRNRIRTAEGLLDRDLSDPGVRSELWLALSVMDQGG